MNEKEKYQMEAILEEMKKAETRAKDFDDFTVKGGKKYITCNIFEKDKQIRTKCNYWEPDGTQKSLGVFDQIVIEPATLKQNDIIWFDRTNKFIVFPMLEGSMCGHREEMGDRELICKRESLDESEYGEKVGSSFI